MITNSTNPFALVDSEKEFTSDDWAWQFLRLNARYRTAFDHALKQGISRKAADEITGYLSGSLNAVVATHNLQACARDFGIAAWLDPDCITLPELKNGGSWFFPIKRVVPENHRRLDVASEPPRHFRNGPQSQKARYPYLKVQETPFGYTPRIEKMSPAHFDPLQPQQIFWVAVDCSVPPDGQMRALRALAEQHKAFWKQYRVPRSDGTDIPILPITVSEHFAHMAFKRAHDRGLGRQDTSDLWRVVGINPLLPLAKQITELEKQLTSIHRALRDGEEGKLNRKFPSVFPYSLRQQRAPGGHKTKTDPASYVKALLILLQHKKSHACHRECEQERRRRRENGEHDAEGDSGLLSTIAIDIGLRGPGASSTGGWREDFESRMPFHLRRAYKTVEWGYRWLVHAQTFGHPKKPPRNGLAEPD